MEAYEVHRCAERLPTKEREQFLQLLEDAETLFRLAVNSRLPELARHHFEHSLRVRRTAWAIYRMARVAPPPRKPLPNWVARYVR